MPANNPIDEKVKVSSGDTTPDVLENKVTVGGKLALVKVTPGGNEQLQVATTAVVMATDVAGQVAGLTGKATPTTADLLLIEDAADSNNKKKITIGVLPAAAPAAHDLAGSLHNADTITNLNTKLSDGDVISTKSAEVSALTAKTPTTNDIVLGEDAAASYAKKKFTVGDIQSHAPSAHDLAGSSHNADTITNLNTKLSDGDVISTKGAEINALTSKGTPVGDDVTMIEDSAASFAKKKTKLSEIISALGGNFGIPLQFFGDGSDGDVTISGATTLTKDMYYNNLTINASQELKTNGFRVFVKGNLTLNSGSIISCDGGAGQAYQTNANATGGTYGGSGTGASLGSGGLGGDGNGNPVGGGNNGADTTRCPGTTTACDGGKGGDATDGGLGGGTAGVSSSHCDYINPWRQWPQVVYMFYPTKLSGYWVNWQVQGGAGGSGGGGYDGATDYSGGAGGGGGGVVLVMAYNIVCNAACTVRANGGAGGAGRTNVGTGTGGGGGGGGGFVVIWYFKATSIGNLTMQANGGAGGAGRAAGANGVAGVTFSLQIIVDD